jgi:CheY-like chemotaxis protein
MITNSAKYGALSDARGKVEIDTSIGRVGRLLVNWKEYGGPPVRPPTRRGFGSTVIERSIEHDLKGVTELEFALAGVTARFTIPATYVRVSSPNAEEGTESTSILASPVGPMPDDVLLVEDNMIIALDTEDTIHKLGVNSVRTVGGVAEALREIAERAPDFALLDVNLGAETSFEIAEFLTTRNIRFAFATGYGEQVAFPASFADAPRVRKPYSAETLRAVLSEFST